MHYGSMRLYWGLVVCAVNTRDHTCAYQLVLARPRFFSSRSNTTCHEVVAFFAVTYAAVTMAERRLRERVLLPCHNAAGHISFFSLLASTFGCTATG